MLKTCKSKHINSVKKVGEASLKIKIKKENIVNYYTLSNITAKFLSFIGTTEFSTIGTIYC